MPWALPSPHAATEPIHNGLVERRLTLETRCDKTIYAMPNGSTILEVRHVPRGIPHALLIFEVPMGASYWRVYSVDGPPSTRRDARAMLTAAHHHFHRPMWYQLDNELILSQSPPDDGDLLSVTCQLSQDAP